MACMLLVVVKLHAQQVTLHEKGATLSDIFKKISQQTGYKFVYRDEWITQAKKVSIDVKNGSLQQALDICFKDQPVAYSIVEKTVVLVLRKDGEKTMPKSETSPVAVFKGRVLDNTGKPLEGATIVTIPEGKTAVSNSVGTFSIESRERVGKLKVSFTGFNSEEIDVNNTTEVTIVLSEKVAELDEVVQIAYGTTSKRYSTGSVEKVSAAVIESQPVTNPLAALEGRVPGLIVTQTTGVNGGAFKVQIRGQNSIVQGSNPLFIVDGMPFAPGNTSLSTVNSAVGLSGISPFSSINPDDIESVEVLKDADATSIYGSRGANGVVLITTKKGKAGKTTFALNVYTGSSKVTKTLKLMNTQQFVSMRNEAYKNDNKTPTVTTAPDLLVWDTTAYTDWTKQFIGGTANTTDINASLSGGTGTTRFMLGGTYHRESTVFPTTAGDNRAAMHFNLNHVSINRKFSLDFQANYVTDVNRLPIADLTSNITLAPDYPGLTDSVGNLVWNYKGFAIDNPMGNYLKNSYKSTTDNLISNLVVSYQFSTALNLKVSGGYNSVTSNEFSVLTIASQNPAKSPLGTANIGSGYQKSWIIEPQLTYKKQFDGHSFDVLAGSTIQQNKYNSSYVLAGGYTSDALLHSLASATSITANSSDGSYKYAAIFGRLNYRYRDLYVLNLTGRRDGSSRFGPGRQWANFGAAGAAWIFSNEHFFRGLSNAVSFGKLRASYGSTGNDQIGDYQFYDSWTPLGGNPYQQAVGLIPSRLYNPDYGWEINKKFEIGTDISFFKSRIMLTAAWFRNRSSNQLVNYTLPSQTGFTSILANLPAVVQNTGWEFTVNTKNVKTKNFSWSSMINLTIPRNKLIDFPGLASSSYASTYVIGQPLSVIYRPKLLGVDAGTGVYKFEDLNKDGVINTNDNQVLGRSDVRLYGGLSNTVSWKGVQLDIFFEARQQTGKYYLTTQPPGIALKNQPVEILNHWQTSGDNAIYQQFTTTSGTPAYKAQTTLNASNGVFTDASYIRLKNISLMYAFPDNWIHKVHVSAFKIYVRAQNLLTISGYKGSDPETLSYLQLPTLRTIVGGFQITL